MTQADGRPDTKSTVLVIDDPYTAREPTPAERARIREWYARTLAVREALRVTVIGPLRCP